MKTLTRFFIQNYKFTLLLTLFMLIIGVLGIKRMNAENFPAVSFATATIVTPYEGASAYDIETKITKPIEDEIQGVVGIKDIVSTSQSGLSMIVIRVDMNHYDVPTVMNELQKKVDGVRDLPNDLREQPDFTEVNSEEIPILEIALTGPNDQRQRDKAADDLKQALEDIKAVKEVLLKGHSDREFSILLDQKKLAQLHISVTEVLNKIRYRNVNIPGGTLKESDNELLLRIESKIKNKSDLENILVRSNFEGNLIYLKDIATIEDTQAEKRIVTRYNGQPATILTVIKKAGEDIVDLVDLVSSEVEGFSVERMPTGLKYHVFFDQSREVKNKLNVLTDNAVAGLVLVLFFLFLFLPGKIGFAAGVSLPLAVMSTLGLMPVFGMNLNTITILALIISIGMLVDNSVIISESFERNRLRGLNPEEAAVASVHELAGAITASALTTIAAFLPMLVTKGVMGSFISAIPIIVTLSLLISMGESFFMLPMRLTHFAAKIKQKKASSRLTIYPRFERQFTRLIQFTVRHRWYSLVGFVATVSFSLFMLFVMNQFELFPPEQTEIYLARYEADSGSTVEHTDALGGQLANDILAQMGDKFNHAYATAGEQRIDALDPKGGDGATLGIVKLYANEQTRVNGNYYDVINELKALDLPYVNKLTFEGVINGPPVGSAVSAKIRSNNTLAINQMVDLLMDELEQVPGIIDLKVNEILGENEIFVNIDFAKADRLGLNAKVIGDTIRTAVSGSYISDVTLNNKEVNLKVRFDADYRQNLSDLESLQVQNDRGQLILLSKVVEFEAGPGTPQIKRFNNMRAKTITANVDTAIITADKANQILLNAFNEHQQSLKEVSLYQGGVAETTAESMSSLADATVLAVLGIFALLVYMFNSFLKPMIIISTIPLGLLGFAMAFYAHQRPVSFLAFIGIVGLAGMIVNSGIVLISCIEQLQKESDRPLDEILIEASILRLKPVVVTSLTTISGLFPTAYAIGGSDPILIPMTLAMAWGLTTGTILTLVWVPCAYGLLHDLTQRCQAKKNAVKV